MRRRSLFLLIALFASVLGYSQGTVVFHEDFELPSQADSVISTGPTGWNVGSSLAAQGTYSDSAKVVHGAQNILTSTAMDLTAYSYVELSFDHICKIEMFDSAKVEVSTDNGASWITLTGNEYKGNSAAFSNNGYFNAQAYSKWDVMNTTVSPDNSWWRGEAFDLSTIAANQASVIIRFVLADGNNSTVFENVGWFLDNIQVLASADELVPPVVNLETPVMEDTIYHTGPFQVKATITDNSGIDTAFIVYDVNGGTDDTVGMTASANNLYVGDIPSVSVNDSVSYEVVAIDLSQVANKTTYPQSRKSFIILPSPPPAGCSAPYAALPGMQDFDGLTDGSTSCGNNNPLGLAFWENETTDETDWVPNSGSTPSSSTGPSGDHTTGSGHYLYMETSSCNNKTAILTSPCIDLSNEALPVLEFAYHMYGSSMGTLDVEIYYGGTWTNIFSMSGSQGDQWNQVSIDLSNYKIVTQIRFVGETGTSYYSDMAIDDIKLYSPAANDAAIAVINNPVDPTLSINNNDINIALLNAGSANLTSADVSYKINGGTTTTYNWTGNLLPQSQIDSLVIGTENFSVGSNNIKVWTSNPNNTTDAENNNDTLLSDFYVCNGAYNGAYSIGGSGADFQSIQDALNAIEICGVSGPVTFNLASGTYTGQYEIGNVMGTSAANTITFQAQSGNAADVILQIGNVSDSDSSYVFQLDAADYFVFNDLTIKNTSNQYATVFHLLNGADYNTITNCVIESTPYSSTSTSYFYATGIYVDGYNGHNVFSNNEVNGGTYGIAFENAAMANQVLDNQINGFHYVGIYAEDQDSMIVKNNVVENGPTAGTVYGIRLSENTNFGLVEGNEIHVHSSGSSTNYGLYLYEIAATASDSFVVANNFIRQSESEGSNVYGIRMNETDYVKLVYNTVKIEGANSSATAIYLYESTNSPSGVGNDILNNNFVNVGGGTAIQISEGAGANNMINLLDYNNYHATSGNLMEYDGLFRTNISQIQGSTGQDVNSISADPIFVAQGDLHAISASLNAAAMPLSYITLDIDDEPRSNTPDIGADEFTPAANDVAVTELVSPVSTCSGTQADVQVKLINLGTADLTTGTIHWQVNGSAQGSINFNDNLISGMDSIIDLGSYTFNYGTTYEIKAWLDNPNGVADQNHTNDTLFASVETGLPAGTYTIGGTSADFDSLNHAADYITNYGVCGAVTFEVNSGTFEDNMLIENVVGADQYSIVITSATADSTDVIIKYAGTADDNYVIGVYNTPNVTISNMTIQSLDATNGHAVVFDDGAHNFTLNNNIILGDSTTSTSELAALVYSEDGNAVDSNALIKNNFIKGGSYGIYAGGESSSSGLEPGMIVQNNEILNNTRGGAYFKYMDGIQVDNNNIVGEIDEANYVGLELYYCDNMDVIKNKVFAEYGKYVVRFYYNDGSAANPQLVANNFFSGNELDNYAIYISNNDYLNLYYNSMAKFGASLEPTIYINGGDGLTLQNNVIANYSGDYAIDLSYYSGNPLVASDYNNLYTSGSNLVDNDDTDVADLASWQALGFDINSVSANPFYNDMKELRTAVSVMDGAATPIAGITTDIDGEARDASTPDIGADEYTALGLDLAVVAVDEPIDGCDLSNETVQIKIFNAETNDFTSDFDLNYKVLGGNTTVTETVSTDIASGDTLTYTFSSSVDLSVSTDSVFEIITWVDASGDVIASNDTMKVNVASYITPVAPASVDVDIPWNTSTKIGASSPYSIRWFENLNDTVAIHVGDSFNTPVLTDTTTFYVDAVNGEGELLFTDICHYLAGNGENVPMFPYLVDDMLEITNVGQVPVDLTGYSVDIHTSNDYSGNLPSIILRPGEILLLSYDSDQSPANNMYGLNTTATVSSSTSAGYILRNDAGSILDVVALNGYSFDPSTGVTSAHWSGDIPSSSSQSGVIRVNADNNSASDWIVADDSQPQTLGVKNPGLAGSADVCGSGRTPVTVNVTSIPLQNAAVADVTSPAGGCGLSNETVSVQIYNYGYDPINGNLDAKYSIRGSSNIVSEAVTATIAKNDTITYTFNTPVDLSTTVDSNFTIDVWVELQNDNVTFDDSTSITLFSGASQSSPLVSDITVPYGQSGTFVASSPYNVYWYADAAMTQKLHEGNSFNTPILYDTASYYAVAQELIPDTLSSGLSGSEDYDGIMFDVIAKNSVIIDSFALNLETSSAREIEVYYANGSYEPIEEDASLWSFAGSQYVDNANAQGTLTNLSIGNIKIQAGDTLAFYIRNANGEDLMMYDYSDVKEDNNVKMISGKGVNGLFGYDYSDKGFNGELYYSEVVGCPSLPVEAKAIVQNVPANDAGIAEVIMPAGGAYVNESFEVKALLQNFGQDTLTSVDIDWSINGSAQQTYNWTGTVVPAGGSDTVVLSNMSLNYDHYDIKAWVNNPNGTADLVNTNDTTTYLDFVPCIDQGVYTIGANNGDFTGFADAAEAMNNCGINGAVTFDVAAGTYNEQMSLSQISGASATNMITFQSASGNANDVILSFADTSANTDNYVVNLDGTDHISFLNLTMRAEGADDASVLVADNGSKNVLFQGNIFQGKDTTSTSYGYNLTDFGHENDSAWVFKNNQFLYGSDAINYYGGYSNHAYQMLIENNLFSNQSSQALYISNMDSLTITDNTISTDKQEEGYQAIYVSYAENGLIINRNSMYAPSAKAMVEIRYSGQTFTSKGLFANNMIQTDYSGSSYGNTLVEFYNSGFFDVVFNTMKNSGNNTGGEILSLNSSDNIDLKNNIYNSTGEGEIIYVSASSSITSDYNVYWAPVAQSYGYWGTSVDNLLELQTETGGDMNSFVADPMFVAANDLHITNLDLFLAGTAIPGITTDIDGDTRFATPTIGADEYMPAANDAALTVFDGPLNPISTGSNDVYVTIKNYGVNNLTAADVNWSVDGVAQTSYSWSGNLATGAEEDSILIGSYNFVPGIVEVKAWIASANNGVDGNSMNDTILTNLVSCNNPLNGTYAIGGTNADFVNLEQAIITLENCGVDGAVIMELDSGLYNGSYSLGVVPGASAANTVTFTSKSGVNTDVVLTHAPTSAADNFTLKIDGASHIILKDMTIKSTGANYGIALHLEDAASYNKVENMIIQGVNVQDDDEKFAAVYVGPGQANYNSFVNNEVYDGAAGFYIDGSSTATAGKGNMIDSNIIHGFYEYATYIGYSDSIMIRNNHMENDPNSSYVYTVRVYNVEGASEITGNYIRGNGTSVYPLYIYYMNKNSTTPALIANNMIVNDNNSTGGHGIFINYSAYLNIYYNTVAIHGGSAMEAFRINISSTYAEANSLDIRNNNFVSTSGAQIYEIDADAINGNMFIHFDYNNAYTTGAVLGEWGSTDAANIAEWQNISLVETNSLSVDPWFISDVDAHVNSPILNGAGTPIAAVSNDFDGDLRNANTPDIGADEFVPVPVDLGVIEIVKPEKHFAPTGFIADIEVVVKNFGADTITNYQVKYEYDGQNPVVETINDTIFPGTVDTVTFINPISVSSGNNLLAIYTDVANDGKHSNDTMSLEFLGLPTITPEWSNDMDGVKHFAHDGNPDIWERGVPMGTNINTAHSGANVWMTDLDADYSENTHTYLYTPMFDFSNIQDATLEFWHSLDVENGNDGVNVQYSLNGGVTWTNLGDTVASPDKTNWYNDVIGNMPVWTGGFGWTKSSFKLTQFDNHPTPIQFRFYLYGDAQNHGDGWAIDDFTIKLPVYPKDAGVVSINQPANSTVVGDQVNVEVDIQNFGTDTLYSVPVSYDVNGSVQTETWTGTLYPDSTATFAFNTAYVSPNATYVLKSYTELANDGNASNDTSSVMLNVTQAPIDAGVTAILLPNDTTTQFVATTVSVRIQNFGTDELTSIPVEYQVGAQAAVAETWTGNLASGDSVDYTFSNTFIASAGSFDICARTDVANDYDASNDETCATIMATSINENSAFSNAVVRPNPADQFAIVELNNNKLNGEIVVSLTDMLGNTVYHQVMNINGANNTFKVETANIPAGMYFVNLENANDKVTIKLVVKH